MTYIKLFLIVIHTIISSFMSMSASLISHVFDKKLFFFFKVAKYFSGGIFFLSGIKVKISGLENFDHNKTYVFVSNHSSQYDIPAVQHSCPVKMVIMYKKELEKIPIFGWQLALSPYIKVDRSKPEEAFNSLNNSKKLMDEKNISVLLFAEGTRSKTGEIQPFKRGAFYLAARTGYPIIPVTISGTSRIMPKGSFKINSGEIHVHFDKPVYPKQDINKKEEVDLMQQVRNIIINNYHMK